MTLEGVGIEAVGIAGFDGFHEVAEVVAASAEILDLVALEVVGRAVGIGSLDERALGAVENDADLVASSAEDPVDLFVGGVVDSQTAGLEDHGLVPVIVNGDFGVGSVAGVDILGIIAFGLVAEATTVADDAVGVAIDAESPSGDIGLVGALVARVAVAVESLPVPVVVETPAGKFRRRVGRRSGPEVKIDFFGDFVVAERAYGFSAFVAQAAC